MHLLPEGTWYLNIVGKSRVSQRASRLMMHNETNLRHLLSTKHNERKLFYSLQLKYKIKHWRGSKDGGRISTIIDMETTMTDMLCCVSWPLFMWLYLLTIIHPCAKKKYISFAIFFLWQLHACSCSLSSLAIIHSTNQDLPKHTQCNNIKKHPFKSNLHPWLNTYTI